MITLRAQTSRITPALRTRQAGSCVRLASTSFGQLESTFQNALGEDCIESLKSNGPAHPCVITIGGDQLTGKSSLVRGLLESPLLARTLSLESSLPLRSAVRSTGETMRMLANEHGVSIAELSRVLGTNEANDHGISGGLLVDITLDYKTCEFISSPHTSSDVVVLEGRQPAVMAAFCKTKFPVIPFSIYLTCSIREQALRYVSRECGPDALLLVEAALDSDGSKEFSSLHEVLQILRSSSSTKFDGMERVIAGFEDNMSRDADDKARFDALYGPQCHYKHKHWYDCIIDTSCTTSQEKVDKVAEAFSKWWIAKSEKTRGAHQF